MRSPLILSKVEGRLLVLLDVAVLLASVAAIWTVVAELVPLSVSGLDAADDLWNATAWLQPYSHWLAGAIAALLALDLGARLGTPGGRSRLAEALPSEIDFDGIGTDAEDRVEAVGQRLTSRGADPAVGVVDLVDDIIVAADFLGASDVHIEPKESTTRVAFRVDGLIKEVATLPKSRDATVTNRFRVISKLEIAKLDTPQDGRIEDEIRGKTMNLRVSLFPTLYGPKVVLRLLDAGAHALPPIDQLGIQPAVLEQFRRLIHAPQGILLFTGPAGSGKTTLMYSALREVLSTEQARRNIVTLEDPIERVLPETNQTQVDDKRGLSFASGLRTILRQDPDIIMVGEIRDIETAEIALRAGQTGHLMLSTLHTNSAAAAFSRLMDMGVPPFLLASSVSGVVSIRLVRRLCLKCRVRARPPPLLLAQLPAPPSPESRYYESRGCESCRNTGFIGRTLVFELLAMNEEVAAAILRKQSAGEIQRVAEGTGMVPILADGLMKVDNGSTSLVELLRVVS